MCSSQCSMNIQHQVESAVIQIPGDAIVAVNLFSSLSFPCLVVQPRFCLIWGTPEGLVFLLLSLMSVIDPCMPFLPVPLPFLEGRVGSLCISLVFNLSFIWVLCC